MHQVAVYLGSHCHLDQAVKQIARDLGLRRELDVFAGVHVTNYSAIQHQVRDPYLALDAAELADLDTIARIDNLCDDIGVDTMSTGVAIAVAMDAGYKSFGDAQAAIAMVEEVAAGTAFGKIIGHGPAAVGKHFNHDRVPVMKGQSMAAYEMPLDGEDEKKSD